MRARHALAARLLLSLPAFPFPHAFNQEGTFRAVLSEPPPGKPVNYLAP